MALTQVQVGMGGNSNAPAFSAYQNAATFSITAGNWTLVTVDTKEYDTASAFNNTGSTVGGIPAYSFKPTIAGYYQVSWGVTVNSSGSQALRSMLVKNGSFYRYGSYITITTNTQTQTVSAGSSLVYLNGTTDYINLNGYADAGTANIAGGSAYNTYFTASLIRAA